MRDVRRSRLVPGVLVLGLALAGGCARPPVDAGGPSAVIETRTGPVRVQVEIADTPEVRERGLMHRTTLAEDAGMVFLWPEDTRSAFHMKDTLIPLSIAFFDAEGRILATLDMEPCRADPCPTYDPGVAYRGAIEVGRGALSRWGVTVGDRIRIVR